jgi:hypothetical protein
MGKKDRYPNVITFWQNQNLRQLTGVINVKVNGDFMYVKHYHSWTNIPRTEKINHREIYCLTTA